ncbi:MAG: nicotinate-nucleotide adenylyltransferase [Thiomargarita sp.]|nr:nicotinate-nucleotide adenylyltransferase [Thiomargarita sp.]
MLKYKPIGIFGGTFNPIHHGHLRLALEVYERLNLEKILLIPSARPPHRNTPIISSQNRLKMVKIAIKDMPGLQADARELQRSGFSYTVDTLKSLKNNYLNNPLCLILGMDAFLNLPNWYQWEQLIKLAHLLVIPRNASLKNHSMQNFLDLHQTSNQADLTLENAGKIFMLPIPFLDISATQIRQLIKANKNPKYLLPNAVLDMINENQFYR